MKNTTSTVLTKDDVKNYIAKICIDKYKMKQYHYNSFEFIKKIGKRYIVVSAFDIFLEYPFFSKNDCPGKQLLSIIDEYNESIHKIEIKISKAPKKTNKRDKSKLRHLKRKLKTLQNELREYKKCLKFYRIIYNEISSELKKYKFVETSLNDYCKYNNLCKAMSSRHILMIKVNFR